MSADEFDPTDEQRKAAESLSASFNNDTIKLGKDIVRKPALNEKRVLANTRNHIALGLEKRDSLELEKGNVLYFSDWVIQWSEVCKASKLQVREWLNDSEKFIEHCERISDDLDVNDDFIKLITDVFNAQIDMNNSAVEAKDDKSAKGKGAPPKKKVRSQAKKRNTSSR